MQIIDALKMLKAFTYHGRHREALVDVCIDNGLAYATDGRILVSARLENSHGSQIPQGYPIDAVRDYISSLESENPTVWYEIKEVKKFNDNFLSKYRHMRETELKNDQDRYIREKCPCCGSVVYWDTDQDSLVGEVEEKEYQIEPGDVLHSIKITFTGDDGKCNKTMMINYGYLYTIMQNIGNDVLICPQNKEKNATLYFKNKNGDIKGVLMPLIALGDVSKAECDCSITLSPIKEDGNDAGHSSI